MVMMVMAKMDEAVAAVDKAIVMVMVMATSIHYQYTPICCSQEHHGKRSGILL